MVRIKELRAAFAATEDALSRVWDALADYEDENGDGVIVDSDTIDALIEVSEILGRLESRRIADIKREYESIL